jgi:type IV pilus assembly protein PilC
MFSRQLALPDLIDLCRVMKHNLSAGLSLQRVMKQQGDRGRPAFRPIASRISEAIDKGSSFSAALDAERDSFPVLFLALARLGETTGHLPEVFAEMERYYELELQLRRQFRSATILPIVQFVFAVLIIAAVIFIVGVLAPQAQIFPIFGLTGEAGALAFLGIVAGALFVLYVAYALLSRLSDRFVLALPAVGGCMRSLMMSRFTLALQLTLDSGLPITKALRLSLEATGSSYFASHADIVVQALKDGNTLHDALETSGLFSEDFLEIILTAEESGRVPEVMKQQSQMYHEETARKMTGLTTVASGAVWLCVAGFIIFAIFKFYGFYIGMIDNAAQGKF